MEVHFNNLGYTAYEHLKILNSNETENHLGELASMEGVLGYFFLQSSSYKAEDGHISVQTDFIKQRAFDLASSMQSDSVHGFIFDGSIRDVNVTFTSAFCTVLERTIPLVISIMYGKSTLHYRQHFLVLLQSLPFKAWEEFDAGYSGMTCDFSYAERTGFEAAIRTHFSLADDQPFISERHFRFCEVHFKRTLTRTRSNSAVIPPAKEMVFYNTVLGLGR